MGPMARKRRPSRETANSKRFQEEEEVKEEGLEEDGWK